MICEGCGGIVGRDCFNPDECQNIARNKAGLLDAQPCDFYRLLDDYRRKTRP